MRDQTESNVKVNDGNSKHEDREGERRRDARKDGERYCENAQKRDHQPVDRIDERHGDSLQRLVSVGGPGRVETDENRRISPSHDRISQVLFDTIRQRAPRDGRETLCCWFNCVVIMAAQKETSFYVREGSWQV